MHTNIHLCAQFHMHLYVQFSFCNSLLIVHTHKKKINKILFFLLELSVYIMGLIPYVPTLVLRKEGQFGIEKARKGMWFMLRHGNSGCACVALNTGHGLTPFLSQSMVNVSLIERRRYQGDICSTIPLRLMRLEANQKCVQSRHWGSSLKQTIGL